MKTMITSSYLIDLFDNMDKPALVDAMLTIADGNDEVPLQGMMDILDETDDLEWWRHWLKH